MPFENDELVQRIARACGRLGLMPENGAVAGTTEGVARTAAGDTACNAEDSSADSAVAGARVEAAPLVLMVSGGSDSTALLVIMVRLLETARLHVLHVNHLLRGKDADADEVFVSGLCGRLGVPCTVRRIDVAALASYEHGNIEFIGRRERYAAARGLLRELCARAGVPENRGRIATAHTRDDRVETFVMRMGVGTGPGGLASTRWQSGAVVHPLLSCSREELRTWLVAQGQGWCEDATNLVSDRDRTYVRHEVLPRLRRRYPSLDANLQRTMDLVACEDDYLGVQSRELCKRLSRPVPVFGQVPRQATWASSGEHALALDAAGLAAAPRVLARRVVRETLSVVADPEARIGSERIEQVVDGASYDGFATDLPGGVSVRNVSQTLVFYRTGVQIGYAGQMAFSGWIDIPGTFDLFGGMQLTAREVLVPGPCDLGSLDPRHEAMVDVDGVRRLWVSPPRIGERMVPLGFVHGSKKLASILSDAKVPVLQRRLVPVVRLSDEEGSVVVWFAGLCISECCKVGASTARVVHLTLESCSLKSKGVGKR